MVGEIRDLETAEIAIKAAQTGHLVLSTLHTNDAPQTLTRLVDMGVKPYAIATSVSLIIAQRLARRLCSQCKAIVDVPAEALLKEGFQEADVARRHQDLRRQGLLGLHRRLQGPRAASTRSCRSPRRIGRIIMEGGNAIDIADQAAKEGVWDLRRAGLEKVKAGPDQPRRSQQRHDRIRTLQSMATAVATQALEGRQARHSLLLGRHGQEGQPRHGQEPRARRSRAARGSAPPGHRGQPRSRSSRRPSRAAARSRPKTSRCSAASSPPCSPPVFRWCRRSRSSATATTSRRCRSSSSTSRRDVEGGTSLHEALGQASAAFRRSVREPRRGRRTGRCARDPARQDRHVQGKDRGPEEEGEEGPLLSGRGAGGRRHRHRASCSSS